MHVYRSPCNKSPGFQIKPLLISGPHGLYINTNVGLLVVFMAVKTPTHWAADYLHKQSRRFRRFTANAREAARAVSSTSASVLISLLKWRDNEAWFHSSGRSYRRKRFITHLWTAAALALCAILLIASLSKASGKFATTKAKSMIDAYISRELIFLEAVVWPSVIGPSSISMSSKHKSEHEGGGGGVVYL